MNKRQLIKAATVTAGIGATGIGLLCLSGCVDTIREYNGADAPRFDDTLTKPKLRPSLGLVLGGGGPRGFAHAGVLKVLDEAGLSPELVVGTSVGALMGCLYADGVSGAEIEKMALDLNVARFVRAGLDGVSGSGDAIERFIADRLADKRIEQLKRRFAVTACRDRDQSMQVFNAGVLPVAVRASSAVPGQFKPVRINGELYIDGDEAQPVPSKVARQLGADVVISVDVSAHLESTPKEAPQHWRTRDQRRTETIVRDANEADVIIHPDLGYYASVSDAYRRRSIDLAAQLMREHIPRVKKLLEEQRLKATA